MSEKKYKTLAEFYPYYLGEHKKMGTRVTHFIGTTLFFLFLINLLYSMNTWLIFPTVITPYFFAWIGHFFIEKNRPATFEYPLFSLACDFKMYFDMISGKEKWGE